MSLGIHRKHFLTAADRVRIQKGIEQEERDNFLTMELDPTQNPFGNYGVLRVDDSPNLDSGDATFDFPMLKATPSTEFNFTADDDFTIHWWMKPDPDRANFVGRFGFKLDDYGTIADWPEGSTGYSDHPFDSEPEFGRNGYMFTMRYRLGPSIWFENYQFSSKTPGQDSTDIHYFDSEHEGYDSAGAPINLVDDWNHCAVVHKAGVGLSIFINGNRVIGPVNIEIKRCVRSYGFHFLRGDFTAYFLEGLTDSAGTSPLTTDYPVDLAYPATEDMVGLNHDDWYLGPFQVKRTAIFDPSAATITVPTTEPTSDNDTVLLLLFRYNTTDTIEDVVSLPSTTRTQKIITQYNVDVDTAWEIGPQYARFFTETHSRISVSNFRPWFEPNSAGEPGFFQDDPLFRSYLSARYFYQYIDSSGELFRYPYALVSPSDEFNWDHNDPWTIEFHTIGWNSRTWFGFTCAEKGTYNGWAFAITTDRFYFFSNDPTNSYSRRVGIVNVESAGGPSDFGTLSGEYTGTVEDSFGETLKFDSAGQETPILNHFAIVNEPGTGLSLYFNGRRVFGPVSIHITKPATPQDLYWGSNYRVYTDSLSQDSAGDAFSEQVDYSFPFWDGASTTERRNGFCSLVNNIDFDEVRISKVARYSGDLYEVPMVRHRNDADTLLLVRGQMDDSAGILGTAPFILYEVSVDDDNHEF